jgi:outer membrane protein
MYPSISTFASIGSGYNSIGNEIKGFTYGTDTIGHINIGGIEYPVTVPDANPQFGKSAFFSQVDQNLRKAVGINISVPIFNIGNLRTNWQRAKLDIKTYELQQETDNQQIKQDIYQAYNAAVVALEKFHSSAKKCRRHLNEPTSSHRNATR